MMKLYLAPMEELTGYVFRNALSAHFCGADKYFTPFISPDNNIMKMRTFREIDPSNNEGLNVVPQILANDADLFNEAADTIAGLGYEEININFGCPSNTVTGKFKGSGILRDPELMDRFLDGVFNSEKSALQNHPGLKISVKTRVGYNDTSDFENVVKVLGRYPIFEITVHPRLKKDLYNGSIRMEMFDAACENLTCDIVYNGDIISADEFAKIESRFESNQRYKNVTAVMIGRGAITNPGIFRQIKTGNAMTADELYDFLNDMYETYVRDYSEQNALAKMKEVWSYTTGLLKDEKERSKMFKYIFKAKNAAQYKDAIAVARTKLRSSFAGSSGSPREG